MRHAKALLAIVTAGALALLTSVACGPPCVDDRCSLRPTEPQVTRVDYTKPKPTSGSNGAVVTGPGSAAPVTTGSGSAAPPVTAGSGSAKPVAVGSGSGSAAPPAVSLSGSFWELWDSDQFKMHVTTKTSFPAGTTLKFDLVKTPTKTPFVVTLLVRAPGANGVNEGVWNDCPEGKIKCDSGGTKTHATKKAGHIMLQAGINWTVTGVTDEAKATLVTWTNNLSREQVQLRLLR